jgi:hypothetical protein
MKNKFFFTVFFILLTIGIFLILLFVLSRWINPVLESTSTITTPGWCSSTPNHDPGPHTNFKVTDLDPTIPIESKPAYVIEHENGEYELIYYSTEEQLDDYFKKLQGSYSLSGNAPPTCMMGHYPGEPPGREPCVIPTEESRANISPTGNVYPFVPSTYTAQLLYPYPQSAQVGTSLPYPSFEPGQAVQPQTHYTAKPSSQLFEAPGGWFTLELPAAWKSDQQNSSFSGQSGFFKMAYLPEMGYMRWATQVCERLAYTTLKGWRVRLYEVKGTGSCILFGKIPQDPGISRVIVKIPDAPPEQRFFSLEADAGHMDTIANSIKFTKASTQREVFDYQGGPLRDDDEIF